MIMSNLYAVMAITGLVFGTLGLLISCVCLSMVTGFLRSTHTVQFKPLDEQKIKDPFEPFKPIEEEVVDEERQVLDLMEKAKKKKPLIDEEEITPEEPSQW